MRDHFASPGVRRPWGPAERWYTVTPHATNELPDRPLYIKCTVAGDVRMMNADGDDVTVPMVVGEVLDCRPTRIVSPATTATVIAFY